MRAKSELLQSFKKIKATFISMRFIIITILMLAPFVAAEDFMLRLDGEELQDSITLRAKDKLDLSVQVDGPVVIKDLNVTSSFSSYNAVIEEYMPSDIIGYELDGEESMSIKVPGWAPNGKTVVGAEVSYEKDGQMREYSRTIEVEIEEGSGALGLVARLVPKGLVDFGLWVANIFS